MLTIAPGLIIDESEIDEKFVRASGPGGQNVNKVATAVELRFDPAGSPAVSPDMLERLRTIAGARMTADGVLVIQARRHRTQAQNRADARERLLSLLRQATVAPRRRRKTKPTAAARERRVQAKRQRSATKQRRGRVSGDE
jgi:ribosome-associated protein